MSQPVGRGRGEGGIHTVLEAAGRAHAFRGWGSKKMGANQGSWQRELLPEKINREWGAGGRHLGFNITMYLLKTCVGSLILARGIAAFLPCHAGRQEIISGNHLVCGLLHSAISDAHLGQGLYCSVKWHRAPI